MADRKVFTNSVAPLPAEEGITPGGLMVNAIEPDHKEERMTLLFSLAAPAEKELEERVANGEVMDPEEVREKYSADPADVEKLIAWLQEEGFEIVNVSADRTTVYARATVAQIENSLAVDMTRVTKDGLTYNAAQNAPSLPESVGDGVQAIIGLQPFRHAHKHSRKCAPTASNRASLNGGDEAVDGPVKNVSNAPPYLIGEILKAYNADALGVTGNGETIAILIDTFPADSDVKAFWERNGIAVVPNRIEKVNVKGGTLPPPEGEETLDVEWASGIAPGAKVRIYATQTLRFVDLDRALDRIIADVAANPGLRQVSISLGLGETFMVAGEVATQHQKFLRLAAAGVNVFVSSGDAGSNPDVTGHNSTGPTQAEYESSDPAVIGVGGTTLSLGALGSVTAESAWPSSGGGKSVFFTRPAWQRGAGIAAGNERLVPDVSMTADPNKGAFLVLHGQVTQIGGTSWSAPIWAGICALLNEARIAKGKPRLPFLNPLLYPLIGTASFRDITTGTNGAFAAGNGYDPVTGIGVPNVKKLLATLTS